MPSVGTNNLNRAILTHAIGSGGMLFGRTLRLFKNNHIPGPEDSAPDNYQECDFSGYAAKTPVVFGLPYTAPDGSDHVTAPSAQFTATADTMTNTVYGWYLTDDDGGNVYLAERFEQPIPITGPGQAVFATPDYVLGQ